MPLRLRVTDEFGATGSAATTLTVYVNQPTARLTAAPNPAACSQTVSFDASTSSHGRPDRAIVGYAWSFGDGTPDGSGKTPTHAFAAFGSYTVTLTVTDDNVPARTDTETLLVSVDQGNQTPVAAAGGPYTTDQGQGLSLDGSASTDPDAACGDAIVAYAWDLDNAGTWAYTGAAATLPWSALSGFAPGVAVPLRLRVTDGFGATGTAATTITMVLEVPLAVQADPELNVPITGTHPDTTAYSQMVAPGTAVLLTAPWLHAGQYFRRWKDATGTTLSYPAAYAFVLAGATTAIAEYSAAVTDFYVAASGTDANPGTALTAPMRSLQALLDRYPDIGAGCTVHLAAGVYPENVHLGGNHGGLTIAGAGDGANPATATQLVGQGGLANLDVLLVTASGPDAATPTTIRSLRVSSPGGLGTDSDPDAPFYGGITLDATPGKGAKPVVAGGLLQYVLLVDVTATGVSGQGSGCGILITGSSAASDWVRDVLLDGVTASANGHAGILFCDTQTANITLGSSLPSAIWQNGSAGLALCASPTKGAAQFGPFPIINTSFYANGDYDIELEFAHTDIDATAGCVFVGAATPAQIEARLWHEHDDAVLGLVSFGMPMLGGNRLCWNPTTQRLTLNGANLALGEAWYDLGAPAGAQARIQVVARSGSLNALVKAVDLTGGDHADAQAIGDPSNELYFKWTLRNGVLTVLNQTSVLQKSAVYAAYDGRRNITLIGRAASPGVWLYSHLILTPADLIREYTRP